MFTEAHPAPERGGPGALQGLLQRQLQDFSETASSPGFDLLPSAAKQAAAFASACEALVFDTLMQTVAPL